MLMHVWFARRIPSALRMSMMFIMRVSMRMNYWFVIVEMLVTLRDVEPHPETHQCTAITSGTVIGSASARIATIAPKKGRRSIQAGGLGSPRHCLLALADHGLRLRLRTGPFRAIYSP